MNELFNAERILTFCNYVMWLFLTNIFFIFCNIPLLLFLFFVGASGISKYILLFDLCILPLGPSITALLYTMGKLVRTKDIYLFKDYFKAYKENFLQSLFIWFLQVCAVSMLYVNLEFFKKISYGYILTPILYICIFIIVIMSFYLYPIISRFHVKNMEVLKLSLVLTISRPLMTFGNVVILLFSLMLIEIKASIFILFIASITCFLIMFFERQLLKELEGINKGL